MTVTLSRGYGHVNQYCIPLGSADAAGKLRVRRRPLRGRGRLRLRDELPLLALPGGDRLRVQGVRGDRAREARAREGSRQPARPRRARPQRHALRRLRLVGSSLWCRTASTCTWRSGRWSTISDDPTDPSTSTSARRHRGSRSPTTCRSTTSSSGRDGRSGCRRGSSPCRSSAAAGRPVDSGGSSCPRRGSEPPLITLRGIGNCGCGGSKLASTRRPARVSRHAARLVGVRRGGGAAYQSAVHSQTLPAMS